MDPEIDLVADLNAEDPAGPALTFSPDAWASFVAAMKQVKHSR
jgi:hypothetical protein